MIQFDHNSCLNDTLERRLVNEAIQEEMSFKPLVSLRALLAKLNFSNSVASVKHAPSGLLRSTH